MVWELTAPARQARWRECCQSIDEHRFDCGEAPREQRGEGPFGPVSAPSASEAIAELRSAAR